jgi:hypothetical protein
MVGVTLVSWLSKMYDSTILSNTEVEYVGWSLGSEDPML